MSPERVIAVVASRGSSQKGGPPVAWFKGETKKEPRHFRGPNFEKHPSKQRLKGSRKDVMVYKKDTTLGQTKEFDAQIQVLDIPNEIKVRV